MEDFQYFFILGNLIKQMHFIPNGKWINKIVVSFSICDLHKTGESLVRPVYVVFNVNGDFGDRRGLLLLY